VLTACLAFLCLPVQALDGEALSVEPIPFDKALFIYYMDTAVENVTDLISAFESRQYSILPIVMPDPEFIHLQDGGLLPFNPAAFPRRFARRLIPVRDQGNTVYPVTIMEVPDSGERQILNVAGDVIAEIAAPKDYDPLWYVRLRFPDLGKLDAETAAWNVALYDPSRIMVRFRLITEDELINKVMAESLAAQQSLTTLTFAPLALSYPASGLAFDALSVQTNGTVDVSLSWPSGTLATEGIDIFSSTNLLEPQWQILLTTNVNNAAGSFAFNAPSAGTGGKRFLDAWTHYDGDGDELYDGREVRLYGTDRYEMDTDDDGLADGTEVSVTETDPLDCDSDNDGLVDGYDGYRLVSSYTNGVDANTNGYVDGEYDFDSDPNDPDSDDDTFEDGFEVACGTDPANASSFPATLSGIIVYSGGQSGIVHVLATDSASSWAGARATTLVSPGAYSLSNVPTLNAYWVKAYLDANTNGVRDAWEAWGDCASNSVWVVTNTTGLDITLTDPDMDGDGMPDWQERAIVNALTNDNIEIVDHVFEWADFDGDGVSNGDEIALGTDPNNSNSVPPVLRFRTAQTSVSEAASNVVISIDLLPAASDTVQATLSVIGGNAVNGTDYAFTNQAVTFSTAETNEQINVAIYENAPGEATESIVFKLDALSGPAIMGTPAQLTVWITDSFADSDSDGLPDSWEQQYFGNLNQNAAGDPDGDNVSNLIEFKQGRHPMAGAVADTNNVLKLNVITPLR